MEKHHFEQAKFWLQASIFIGEKEGQGDHYAVAVALAIHAIIKANDALTFKFMAITARRHDDARRLFEDLIKKNHLKAEYASYGQIIQEAINQKAKADYRISYFSQRDFEIMKRNAEKFIRMVEGML